MGSASTLKRVLDVVEIFIFHGSHEARGAPSLTLLSRGSRWGVLPGVLRVRYRTLDILGSSSVPPSPAANLFDLGDSQLAKGEAVMLGDSLEDDSLDLEVQTHADSVARGEKIIVVFGSLNKLPAEIGFPGAASRRR